MRQLYGWLTLGLVLCGVVAGVGGYFFLRSASTVDVRAEVGKWLLTLAVALVVTGALSMVVKQIDQRRSEREAWRSVLNDLVAANQTVMLARFRLAAHRSALTYQKELAELMRARVELRRICAIGIVIEDPLLREHVSTMQKYLDALGSEYETWYLRVARQQRLDELWLTDQMKATQDGTGVPVLPGTLGEPTQAWSLLQDPARFPRLAALLDYDAFRIDTFRTSYKRAKGCLEKHAGFGNHSTDALVRAAAKLSERSAKFMTLHANLPGDVKTRITEGVDEVEKACVGKDKKPPIVEAAMAKLSMAAADAVSTIYPGPERNGTTAQSPAAVVARESTGPPATSP